MFSSILVLDDEKSDAMSTLTLGFSVSGVPDTDKYMDVKLLGDVTHLLQMLITHKGGIMCIDQESQVTVLAYEYSVKGCSDPTVFTTSTWSNPRVCALLLL